MATNGNRPRFSRFDSGFIARADDQEPAAEASGIEKMVADAVSDLRGFCDSMRADFGTLTARMDSMESARADAADADKAKADAAEDADKAKADAAEGEDADKDKDAAKADAAVDADTDKDKEDADKAKADAADPVDMAAMADSAAARIAAPLRADIERLSRMMPAELSIEQRQAFAAAQEQAETAFQSFGDHAPAPMQGEGLSTYKRRMASKLQGHSDKWKGTKLTSITDDSTLDVIIGDIYNDAATVARRGADVPQGQLSPVTRRTPAGHTIVEYRGNPGAWMRPLAGATRRATGKFITGRN